MKQKSLAPVITFYTIAIVASIALLVLWIVYVVNSYQTIANLAARVGIEGEKYHWVFLTVGVTLLVLLLVFLSLQLAQSISRILAIRKQDEFVANMTHELKSPIAAIKLHAQTLKNSGLSESEKAQFVNLIDEQSDRMTKLIDQGLEINRLRTQNQKLAFEIISVEDTLKNLLAEFEARLTTEGFTFIKDLEKDLRISGNPLALQRIVDNLITNSRHASHPKSKIGIQAKKETDHVVITIWDEGIGIPKHELRKIFKRFYQIGVEIRSGRKGTGLGLAIVKGLVEEMQGTIAVESKSGVGSRFIVRFPGV